MVTTNNLTWKGFYIYKLEEKELEVEEFEIEFKAFGTYWHQDAVMYYKDGTGSPEEEETEVTQITIESIKLNGIVLDEDDFTPWQIDDMKEKNTDAIYDGDYEPEYEDDFDGEI